jgi:hypothetical protein
MLVAALLSLLPPKRRQHTRAAPIWQWRGTSEADEI